MKPEEKYCGSQQQVQPGYTPPSPARGHSFTFSTLMSEKIKFTHVYTSKTETVLPVVTFQIKSFLSSGFFLHSED